MRFCGNCAAAVGAPASKRGDIDLGTVLPGGRVTVSRKGVAVVTAIAVLVVAVAAAGWALIGHAAETSHTITGEMTLRDSGSFENKTVGADCSGSGGYRDLDEGTTVSIKNQDGTLIGTGSLGPGKIEGTMSILRSCVFPFKVADVKDANFFEVEISHRGSLKYSKADMERSGWTSHASLGS